MRDKYSGERFGEMVYFFGARRYGIIDGNECRIPEGANRLSCGCEEPDCQARKKVARRGRRGTERRMKRQWNGLACLDIAY